MMAAGPCSQHGNFGNLGLCYDVLQQIVLCERCNGICLAPGVALTLKHIPFNVHSFA
jgi:hypothetical protein